MKRDSWKVLSKRKRLVKGSKENEWHTEVKYPCIYCGAALGEEHNPGCVSREQTVVIDVTIRMIKVVPEHWTEDAVDFHYNKGSWCASNIVDDLRAMDTRVHCLCDFTTVKYIREATEHDEEFHKLRIAEVDND